jgi:hypothetical protein
MMITIIMVSVGWNYIFELRPPVGLLFTPQVIYEHGEPWYQQGKTPDSSARALWNSYWQSRLVAEQEKVGKEMINFALQSISFVLAKGFFNIP